MTSDRLEKTRPLPLPPRPRRALLFVPGSEPRRIVKAASLPVDGVIIDLEDAVALGRKEEARREALRAIAELDFGTTERLLRINPIETELGENDLEALEAAEVLPDALVLPKVDDPQTLVTIDERLRSFERARGLKRGRTQVLAIIETALGVVRLAEIAAGPRLVALIFGAEDLCGDVGALRTTEGHEVSVARQLVVLHSAAQALQAVDTPFLGIHDDLGLRRETRAALELGYTGKLAIHPSQVAPIVDVLTPTEPELAEAERLLSAHMGHQAEGRGVFALDGRMVDFPMVRAAQRVVQRAKLAGMRTKL